jgi:hypothetical protein
MPVALVRFRAGVGVWIAHPKAILTRSVNKLAKNEPLQDVALKNEFNEQLICFLYLRTEPELILIFSSNK